VQKENIGIDKIRNYESELPSIKKLCKNKKYPAVLKLLEELKHTEPNNADICAKIANIYLITNEYQKAVFECKNALRYDPNNWLALKVFAEVFIEKKEYNKVIITLSESLARSTKKPIYKYWNLARAYMELEDYSKALKYLNEAIDVTDKEIDNNHMKNGLLSGLYADRGKTYSKKNRNDEAIKDYERALKLNWKNFNTYKRLGITYFKRAMYGNSTQEKKRFRNNLDEPESHDDLKKSVENLKIAQEHCGDLGEILKIKGTAYVYLKEYNNAINDLEKYIERFPNDEEASQILNGCRFILNNGLKTS
jgi:tetratricopeptide (TPR) repeat protein